MIVTSLQWIIRHLNGAGAPLQLYPKWTCIFVHLISATFSKRGLQKTLDKYISIQQKISDQVKSIGGRGTIHGAIVDIDFYNHIYVNPNDLVITGYFAYDIIFKQVYKNIPSLLKAKCPALFENYQKLLSEKTENALVVAGNTEIDTTPKDYFETDIYKASREIKKMQKVNKGILSTWYDLGTGANLLE